MSKVFIFNLTTSDPTLFKEMLALSLIIKGNNLKSLVKKTTNSFLESENHCSYNVSK